MNKQSNLYKKIILGFVFIIIINTSLFCESNIINQEFQNFGFSLLNNGLFILPPLIWNIVFIAKTPTYYSLGSAPKSLIIAENILRTATFISPFFVPININHAFFNPGLVVFSVGLGLYFSSWLLLMYFPELEISQKNITRLLPALTPIIWLVGIGLMSQAPISYSILATGFICTHIGEYLFRFNIIDYNY